MGSIKNTTVSESVLKKRSLSLAYHYVREGCARGEWLTFYVKSENNCADIQTKTVPSGHKRDGLFRWFYLIHECFDPYDNNWVTQGFPSEMVNTSKHTYTFIFNPTTFGYWIEGSIMCE